MKKALARANQTQILQMFNLLPDIMFWIKDKHGNIEYANSMFLQHVGVGSVEDVVGKTDYDIFPHYLADQFVKDDQLVIHGQEFSDRLELNSGASGYTGWFITSKRAIIADNHEVLGTYGIARHLGQTSQVLADVETINAPINFIRNNLSTEIRIQDLAEVSGISVSALERRFRKYLRKTPVQFINQLRLEHARRLLAESQLPISDVANQSGFVEHSYFSKQYRQAYGELPSETRKTATEQLTGRQ